MRAHPLPQLTALVALGALAACAHRENPTPETPVISSPTERHPIMVVETGQQIELTVKAGTYGLTPEDRSTIDRFAATYRSRGHGPVMISVPSSEASGDSAARMAQDARIQLNAAGVSMAAIAASTYDASGNPDAPVVVSYSTFEAEAPECAPIWSQDLAGNRSTPWPSFGCATMANLAAMIDDPRDLEVPRDEDPRDSARRAAVLEKYRQGEPTGATRSQDERVAVSDAVR